MLFLCILLLTGVSNGLVQFSHSTVYDIYDFQGVKEDAYMSNLVVYDYSTGNNLSIAMLSQHIQTGFTRKLPLELETPGRYSILNLNADDTKASDLAVYVVDRATALSIDYEIYDADTMDRSHQSPRPVVTIMAAGKFLASARPGLLNFFTARLAGFDNAQVNNTDDCVEAYQGQFDGFQFHVNGPLISFMFNKTKPVPLTASYEWENRRNLSQPGFITSPGFHGCTKVDALQVFRQWNGGFHGEKDDLQWGDKLNVTWNIDADVTREIVIKDITNGKTNSVIGVPKNLTITMENTQWAQLYYLDASPPHGFIARHRPI